LGNQKKRRTERKKWSLQREILSAKKKIMRREMGGTDKGGSPASTSDRKRKRPSFNICKGEGCWGRR